MTDAARQFIQPLTFAALTGNKVITGLFSSASADDMLSSAERVHYVNRQIDFRINTGTTAEQATAKYANNRPHHSGNPRKFKKCTSPPSRLFTDQLISVFERDPFNPMSKLEW